MRRSAMKPRTVPMQRTPLKSTNTLKKGASLGRFSRGAGDPPNAPRKASPRQTGFTQKDKLTIRTRAGNGDPDNARCEATGVFLGRYGGEIQHRAARGIGGSRLRNHVANGVLLSREAHAVAESRDPRMHEAGFWLLSGQDPLRASILLHGRVLRWLADDGTYLLRPPEAS
jgi:hypothetical protein